MYQDDVVEMNEAYGHREKEGYRTVWEIIDALGPLKGKFPRERRGSLGLRR